MSESRYNLVFPHLFLPHPVATYPCSSHNPSLPSISSCSLPHHHCISLVMTAVSLLWKQWASRLPVSRVKFREGERHAEVSWCQQQAQIWWTLGREEF